MAETISLRTRSIHPSFKTILVSRWPQLIVQSLLLAAFLFTILAGWFGTPVGNHNFSIVFLWIAWWAFLILIAVPIFGRGWCSICPIPLPGEWLQRGRVLVPQAANSSDRQTNRFPLFNRARWPKALRNIWLQNGAFLLLALFSPVILTTPGITSWVLFAMLLVAIGVSLLFARRTFCRYLCPVSGFIGLYSQASPVELRIRSKKTCAACVGKPCYNGSSDGYGCPWDVFPAGMTKNTNCGLCMECLRTCPHENISVNLRSFSGDLDQPLTRLDEAFKGFIMLGSAMIYSAVLLGPWGQLKNLAYGVFEPGWFGYAVVFLAIILVLLPAVFMGFLRFDPNLPFTRATFTAFSTSLLPLGLMFWVAFSLSFLLSNGSYISMVFSDPLGWGWDVFGTASIEWMPLAQSLLQPLQGLALAGGLIWSAKISTGLARARAVSPAPVILFGVVATFVMSWLLI